jgi:4-amino-4-deoxy-L-arabinose transferase-like glycosyltransferase
MRFSRHVELILICSVAIFAFAFSHACGSRGFFPLDQSIVYDGAWRIIQGQAPFKDFVSPIGPVTFLYQAFIFCIFGANFASYLLGAALINMLAAILAYLLVKKFSPKSPYLPLSAALLSSVWFYSQMGTTYPDQTAIFLCLTSLFLTLYRNKNKERSIKIRSKELPKTSLDTPSKGDAIQQLKYLLDKIPRIETRKFESADFAAGVAWGLAFLTKQNYAVFFFPLLILTVPFAPPSPRVERLHSLLAGVGAIFALFIAWLLIFSDWHLFMRYFLVIPITEGLRRLEENTGSAEIRLNIFILFANFALAISALTILISAVRKGWANRRGDMKPFLATITLYLITYSYVMIKTTNNNPVNAWGFLPLIIGFGFPISKSLVKNTDKRLRWLINGIGTVILILLLLIGSMSAWHRNALDIASPGKFEALSWPPNANSLLWSDQTPAGLTHDGRRVVIFKEDVERLTKYLSIRNAKFFVFPDFTALYGFVGTSSPQPLLWFHKGLTYPQKYDEQLDAWIVDSLKKAKVDTIVMEEVSWFTTASRLNDFPLLKKFISANFAKKGSVGIYAV